MSTAFWLKSSEEAEEWAQDHLVEAFRERWEEKRAAAVRSLRDKARAGSLDEIRAAEARIATIDEVLKDVTPEEEQ